MRVPFNQLFQIHPNGAISPRVTVQVGGVVMGSGVTFGQGVSFGGLNLATIKGQDLEVTFDGQKYTITGYYNR